jgi:hypothetical protein
VCCISHHPHRRLFYASLFNVGTTTRTIIVQGGAYAEHQIVSYGTVSLVRLLTVYTITCSKYFMRILHYIIELQKFDRVPQPRVHIHNHDIVTPTSQVSIFISSQPLGSHTIKQANAGAVVGEDGTRVPITEADGLGAAAFALKIKVTVGRYVVCVY